MSSLDFSCAPFAFGEFSADIAVAAHHCATSFELIAATTDVLPMPGLAHATRVSAVWSIVFWTERRTSIPIALLRTPDPHLAQAVAVVLTARTTAGRNIRSPF